MEPAPTLLWRKKRVRDIESKLLGPPTCASCQLNFRLRDHAPPVQTGGLGTAK